MPLQGSLSEHLRAVDNEIEIASNTHQDMHPDPIGYDEELERVINTATVAKSALPDVQVMAPSTCAWLGYVRLTRGCWVWGLIVV